MRHPSWTRLGLPALLACGLVGCAPEQTPVGPTSETTQGTPALEPALADVTTFDVGDGRSVTIRHYKASQPKGAVTLTTGGGGAAFSEDRSPRSLIAEGVFADGYDVVSLGWVGLGENGGIFIGMQGRTYRYAFGEGYFRVYEHVFDLLRSRLPQPYRIVAAGNSGSGMQPLYAAQERNIDSLLSGIVASGGPPMYQPVPGFDVCLGHRRTDLLMGWPDMTCESNTLSPDEWAAHNADVINAGRHAFSSPVHFVNSIGHNLNKAQGEAMRNAINAAGGTATSETISGSQHDVDLQPEGALKILAKVRAFLAG